MRTTAVQFEILVDFMERNGDLCKPSSGSSGRVRAINAWDELSILLNTEGSGQTRTPDKWRKVWSDLKNNVKKKAARIHQSGMATGGGPAVQLILTDLEQRVLQIIGIQAATGLPVEEIGFSQNEDVVIEVQPSSPMERPATPPARPATPPARTAPAPARPGIPLTSPQPHCSQTAPPLIEVEPSFAKSIQDMFKTLSPSRGNRRAPKRLWQSSPRKPERRTKTSQDPADAFIKADKQSKELDKWRIHIEEERIRQRDRELDLQEKWIALLGEMLQLAKSYIEKQNKD